MAGAGVSTTQPVGAPTVAPTNQTAQTAMSPGQPPYSQFGNNPQPVAPPQPPTPPTGALGGGGAQGAGGGAGRFGNWNPQAINQYGGQQIAGANPQQADYQSVQGYADAAHQNARRYLDPQQKMQNERFQQDLINKGIDPNSPQGQAAAKQLSMQQADANNAAAFGAMQFGQGIQNQMAQQEQQKAQLAGNMQQALWNQQGQASNRDLQWGLGQMQNATAQQGLQNQLSIANMNDQTSRMGLENQYNLGMAGMNNQRYGMDLQHQLGMGNLNLAQNQAEHGQMMDLLGYDQGIRAYNDAQQWKTREYNDQQQMMQDALYNQMYGNTPIPGMNATDPYGWGNTMMGVGADTRWWNTMAAGNFNVGW